MKYSRYLMEILIFEGRVNRAFDFSTGRKQSQKVGNNLLDVIGHLISFSIFVTPLN
jgi:hypothetical protein